MAGARVSRVGVDVADPELDADVRAVLAALAVEVAPGADPTADLVVTDRAGHTARAASGLGAARVVTVAPDRAVPDDHSQRSSPDRGGNPSLFDDNDNPTSVIRLPSGTGDLVARLLAPLPGRAGSRVVVAGAVGGCGASTLAAALAVRAAQHRRTLLVESDPRGTGLDLLLGVEGEPGLRLQDVRADLGGPDPEALWAAVPKLGPGLGLLARSRDPDEADSRVPAGDGGSGAMRSHQDCGGLVVADAGTPGIGESVGVGADVVVVVTRADLPGAVAAGRALREAPGAVLVVRAGRGDPVHAADVAGFAGAARWYVLPELRGVRRAAGPGGLSAALGRRGFGGARRLGALADALLRDTVLREALRRDAMNEGVGADA